MKESHKFDNIDNSPLVPWNISPYFPHNFRWLSYFGIFFAFCTNSFARSFASSINITGSSLVIRHNQAQNVANQKNRVSACMLARCRRVGFRAAARPPGSRSCALLPLLRVSRRLFRGVGCVVYCASQSPPFFVPFMMLFMIACNRTALSKLRKESRPCSARRRCSTRARRRDETSISTSVSPQPAVIQ